ncbi:hypothetical protein BpHYR1_020932 [Brachionus plicatilis]|uniref:Methyltransferase FkbM domain-containing protein n=1 Tax=Brachionus plicatilis TaxID=10195 RepID=A0A3M7RRB6_BRAPC|nr:hypothetical protein BpHYR1_020932 [Brachionus plicatilis]
MKTSLLFLIIILALISVYLLYDLIDLDRNNLKIFTSINIENKRQNHIKIIDLSKEVCPKEKYDSFNCVNLLEIYISPILCIHNKEIDITSQKISRDGIKEKNIIEFFLDHLLLNTESLFIDIGSHVGLYSMFAAKLGRDVVAVEAFSENIFRFHKAANLNNVIEKITLLNNAISDKKGLTTIILDDLIDVLPKQPNGKGYKKAVLKIDIEGYEPYAFLSARK